jgi:hypothetical protein
MSFSWLKSNGGGGDAGEQKPNSDKFTQRSFEHCKKKELRESKMIEASVQDQSFITILTRNLVIGSWTPPLAPPREFHKFPELPLELRQMIW